MPASSMIDEINETTLNAALSDVAALVKHWQNLPTAGEINLRLIMGPDGCIRAEYIINGQVCSVERPMVRLLEKCGRGGKRLDNASNIALKS